MKRTLKTIIALALALTMICALGTTAFADSNTVVTKNPTDETRYVGETAIFIANAANYDSIEWLFIAPNGTQCKLDAFKTQFPGCTVTGQGTTELRIANLQTGLNGWKVFCCFSRGNNSITTTAAKITVLVLNAPVTTAPVTTYYTTYVPTYFYYEPGYYYIDGVYYYSDGVTLYVIDEDYDPDFILADGSRVYDLNKYNFEPDYVIINGVRVYSDGSVG